MITTATLKARKNANDKVVVAIEITGLSPMPVPKKGRLDEAFFLQCDGKTVEVKRGEHGRILSISYQGKYLYQDDLAQQVKRSTSSKKPDPPLEQACQKKHRVFTFIQMVSQRRAKHALAAVKEWEDSKNEDDQKKLRSYASSLPAMVLMSGFGQTCAFYLSKDGNHKLQYQVLADWLYQQGVFTSTDLMKEITECSAPKYQLAQAEALAYLEWLKRFSKAYLKDSAEKGEDDAQPSAA